MTEKEKAKIRAEIITSLKESYESKDKVKVIKVKEINKSPKNYSKLLTKKKW
jgi:hypothetical protein